MDDIDELFADARDSLNELIRMHAESMEAGEVVPGMRPRIKSVLEHQRSALDYLVPRVNARYGKKPPRKPYYPMASKPGEFNAQFDRYMPEVRTAYPPIAEAFARHQPFRADCEWLKWLSKLVNPNKHSKLTQQTQRTDEQYRGASGVTVRGIRFVLGSNPPTFDPTGAIEGGPWTKETITEWAFVDPPVFVGIALNTIQRGVESTVEDVRQAAAL
jgi:hypothetical protein